jgi:ferredoxin-NADP reductase
VVDTRSGGPTREVIGPEKSQSRAEEATHYLCGLRPFLRAMVGSLARAGVPLAQIRYEFFGPADELLAA